MLARIEQDDRSFIEKEAHRLLGNAETTSSKYLSKAADRLVSYADRELKREQAEGRMNTRSFLARGAQTLASLIDENHGKAMASAITSFTNQADWSPKPILEMINEVIGITDQNRGVYELVNRVKYAVSGVRQDHRETLPKLIAGKFTRKLDKREWSRMHLGLGKTDIAVLGDRLSAEELRKILTDGKALEREIQGQEEQLRSLAPSKRVARDYLKKADELAEYMVNGKVSENLLRNADAIALLMGEESARVTKPSEAEIQAIDELTTLYALAKLDEGTRKTLEGLARDEAEGIDFVTHYLGALRKQERAKKTFSEEARLNGWKGHIPSETRDGSRLMVADDRDHNRLVSLGYTRLGDYRGSGVESGKRGYYFSAVAGANTYHQGVLQTVNTSVNGVDPRTGYTVNGTTAGRVPRDRVKTIQRKLREQGNQSPGEPLIPVYNAKGEVVAYERSMAPEGGDARPGLQRAPGGSPA